MALFYVTGTSGSGKSTICNRLRSLGYEVYDTDDSINEWHDRSTGEVATYKPGDQDHMTKWVKEHDFLMPERTIQKLFKDAAEQDIFICGHASNDVDFINYFKKVFCLVLSKEKTRRRLTTRTNNSWGNDPKQLDLLMEWYKPTLERYQRIDATMIDATQPVDDIIAEILEHIKS